VKRPASVCTGGRLVNPERPPAGVFGDDVMLVMVVPAIVSLKENSWPPVEYVGDLALIERLFRGLS
jgi:hypothetical protein